MNRYLTLSIIFISMCFLFGCNKQIDKVSYNGMDILHYHIYVKDYEIISNDDKTKTYILYNNDGMIEDNTMINAKDIKMATTSSSDYYFPTNKYQHKRYNDYWLYEGYQYSTDIYKADIKKVAEEFKCNYILNNMKDFYYYPYAICDFHKYNLEELKMIKNELSIVFDNYKEKDMAGLFGFNSNCLIANIKAVNEAIDIYNEELHNKYLELDSYIYNNDSYGCMALNKGMTNVVSFAKDIYEMNPSENEFHLFNFKNKNELYCEALLEYQKDIVIPNEIVDNIKINDKLVIFKSSRDEMVSQAPIVLYCENIENTIDFREKRINRNGEITKVGLYWGEEGPDESGEYYVNFYQIKKEDEVKFLLHNTEGEYEDDKNVKLTKTVKIPVRILKDARVLGAYYYYDIDDFYSDYHDYQHLNIIEPKKNSINFSQLLNGKYYFEFHPYFSSGFYYPINEKVSDYYSDFISYDEFKNIDELYVDVLICDEKGYITGIYKTGS